MSDHLSDGIESDGEEVNNDARDQPEIQTVIHRRALMQSALATGAALLAGGAGTQTEAAEPAGGFVEIPQIAPDAADAQSIAYPAGYSADVVMQWGDPVLRGASKLDIDNQTAASQLQQFGYNNDFIAFMPLPRGSKNSDRGLLCVNHEYTNPELMFPGVTYKDHLTQLTDEQLRIEMAAHGHSVVEIRRTEKDGVRSWQPVPGSYFNRRISALNTQLRISGPAAGDKRMQTKDDSEGLNVTGMLNNCAGGVTPWGTVLSGEENFHYYFTGDTSKSPEAGAYRRYGIGGSANYAWDKIEPRFNVENEPNEPNRFGWVVEIDPFDPESKPVKRTALGRFRHEGGSVTLCPDNRVVVYMGDDQYFEYVYKFVSNGKYDPNNPKANRDLLDDGVLYVARFGDDGMVHWLPLIHGRGPLDKSNGFDSQADVLIETRRAASLLGATPMDRPEDVEDAPGGNVYVMLTKNSHRTPEMADAANPSPGNQHGQIIELVLPGPEGAREHAAISHRWEMFLRAGDWHAGQPGEYQKHHPTGWLSCPDNCAFDNQGRMWISTDGAPDAANFTDGLYMCELAGPRKALTRRFFSAPAGAEVCGPCFTPDSETVFVAVQHPGEGSDFSAPSTRWPNKADSNLPPMPAVVAINAKAGSKVGGA